jgi:hypothetical protein
MCSAYVHCISHFEVYLADSSAVQAVGPLFPSKRYTLLNSTAISIGCYMGIAILTTLFVFPETMSHAAMGTLAAQLARVQTLLEMQDTDHAAFHALRALVITAQQQRAFFPPPYIASVRANFMLHIVSATSGFLTLEFSWGKWNGDDVRGLEEPMITLITRAGARCSVSGGAIN